MKKFSSCKKLILITILFCIVQNISSQNTDLISVKAIPNRDFTLPGPNDFYTAQFKDCLYKIRPNGLVTKYFANNSDSISFNLVLEKNNEIAYAEVCHFKNSLIVCYTETDSESSGSCIAKYDLNSLKADWIYSKLGFNLSTPIINNNCIYLTSFCVIVKLDIYSGKEIFRLEIEYDRSKYSFNSFFGIDFHGDTAIFLSHNWFSKKLDRVIVNDRTNKLIMIDK